MTDKITIDSALLQQALDALDIVSLELGIDWLRPEFAEAGNAATALREALAAPQPEDGGWLQSGGLLYRLTDERWARNRDEIRVTMADGEQSIEACTQRAWELLDRISSDLAPQRQPRPFRKCDFPAVCQRLGAMASGCWLMCRNGNLTPELSRAAGVGLNELLATSLRFAPPMTE